jgi:hypothetical protein
VAAAVALRLAAHKPTSAVLELLLFVTHLHLNVVQVVQ